MLASAPGGAMATTVEHDARLQHSTLKEKLEAWCNFVELLFRSERAKFIAQRGPAT